MKRLLARLLATMMILGLAACNKYGVDQDTVDNATSTPSASAPAESAAPTEPVYDLSDLGADALQAMSQEEILSQITPFEPIGQIIAGSTTPLNGDFIDGWTNSASNAEVKALLGGYGTLAFTKEGRYIFDPITLKSWEATTNADGSKTYSFVLNENLLWNNGTQITAKDYVGSLLINASDELKQVDGAQSAVGAEFVGYTAYNNGENKVFTGVRLLGDFEFAVTIAADNLPYFHDVTLAAVGPTPLFVVAPGVEVRDVGQGAYFTEAFTVELLQSTILGTNSDGYRYNPTVTSGPYNFVSYSPENSQAIVEANPLYLGAYDGAKAKINRILWKRTTSSTEFDELATGNTDISGRQSGGTSIKTGLNLVEKGGFSYAHFPRHGYRKIGFACNVGPTQFVEVRQAVAWMLDRDEFARQSSQGFAIVVDGYYGQAQWEYAANKDALASKLTKYTYNPSKAEEVLIAGGWTLNEKGADFVKGTDAIRYKKLDDGSLMALKIRWMNTPDNPVSDLLNAMLIPAVKEIGMEITGKTVQFSELLDNYYQDVDEPSINMFNLGTGFNPIQYPEYCYNTDLDTYGGSDNTNFISDADLFGYAEAMAKTEPGDTAGFSAKWLDFQVRWNYLLPDIPLYSDDYHVFFTDRLQGYEPSSLWAFQDAILRATISE